MYVSGISKRLIFDPNSRSSSKPQMHDCRGSEKSFTGVLADRRG